MRKVRLVKGVAARAPVRVLQQLRHTARAWRHGQQLENPDVLEYIAEELSKLEHDPSVVTRADAFMGLRRLGLEDFGYALLTMPNAAYPKLSRLLPAMADDEVQRNWTGNAGVPLLRQSAAFVRAVSYNFARHTGRSLEGARVLDFGCGYGRLARLMYYFVDEPALYGVDPWDLSIELCRKAGLGDRFRVSEYLPTALPVDDTQFDLLYAFSVFTHLSERATLASLRALRRCVAGDGLLVITIRPVEYWAHDPHTTPAEQQSLAARHRSDGFAFNPHRRAAVDGDVTYGDTSCSLDWLARAAPEWRVLATDRSLDDPFQRYVFLAPVSAGECPAS